MLSVAPTKLWKESRFPKCVQHNGTRAFSIGEIQQRQATRKSKQDNVDSDDVVSWFHLLEMWPFHWLEGLKNKSRDEIFQQKVGL